MSVINKMLQDLDKRTAGTARLDTMSGQIQTLRAAKAGQPPWRNIAWITAGGLLMLGVGLYMSTQRHASAPPVPPILASLAAPVTAPATAMAAPATAAPAAVAGANDKPASAALQPERTPPVRLAKSTGLDAFDAAASPSASARIVPKAPKLVLQMDDEGAATASARAGADLSRPASGKKYSTHQKADNAYKEAVVLNQQGRTVEAQTTLRRSLEADPMDFRARQMLAGLLIDAGRLDEARVLLADGLNLDPQRSDFAMMLARLDLELGNPDAALQVLQGGLGSAGDEPQYHALLAAVLLKKMEYDAAVQHYLVALRSDPAMPTWLVGVGVALEAQGKMADANAAYQRAFDGGSLSPELARFVADKLNRP
ncbi:MAG: tetratricopeptide repeat protein [Burkholderiaceae bacterium]|nr:tetratricopeptide repeat protein [Roseateles sp.]MBV8468688.1 tetratricopeptide repeat protein [Burkholderiaceae bacterium]